MLGGRVTDVNEDKRVLSLRTPNGEQRVVCIPDDALIMRDRRRSRFEEIEPGDMVRLRLERREDGSLVAVRMMVRSATTP